MWPLLIVMAQILVVDLPRPLELGQDAAEITLIAPGDTVLRQQVGTIAADPEENLVLHLHSVEADKEPEVSWEVYVASSDEADSDNAPALVGLLSLFGVPSSAEFVFPLDVAFIASEPVGLKIVFRPISGLEVDGEPVPPIVSGPVRIGGISLETEAAAAIRNAIHDRPCESRPLFFLR